jgi:hypothetical protein
MTTTADGSVPDEVCASGLPRRRSRLGTVGTGGGAEAAGEGRPAPELLRRVKDGLLDAGSTVAELP